MSTSAVKQITIIHQYQTLPDEASYIASNDAFNPLHKINTHRVKEIVSIPKVHNSLRCNKQKPPSFAIQMSHLKVMSRKQSKKLEGYQKRYRFHTEIKNQHSSRIKTLEGSETKAKIKKIFLPNLKSFEDFDYQTDRIKPSQGKQLTTSHQRHGSHDKQTNFPQVHASNSETSPFKMKQEMMKSERTQEIYNPITMKSVNRERKIYKYIQKVAKSDKGNIRKKIKNQDDQSRPVSQFSPTYQRQSNIIFHNFKNKGIQQTHRQHRKSIIESEPMFNIAKIMQNLDEFLMNYQPLNPKFDIKQFIRDPNVQIVTNQRSIYAGKLINDKMEGKGVLITEKQHFEGQFANNFKKEGFQRNKNGVYQGLYEMGKRNGNGRFVWKNGQIYEGDWRFGKKNGHGIWKSLKGDYYEGEWKDNLQNGKGCYYHKGCSMYRGYFKNSLKQGRGEEQFENGQRYQGEYDSGKPHGYGKYSWANGDTYEGYFVKGSREGKGILRKKNGQIYEGQFKEDLKDGYGKETYLKGEYFQGQFEKGLKISGSYFTKDHKRIQTY